MRVSRRVARLAAAVCVVTAAAVAVTVPAAGQEAGEDDFSLPDFYLDGYGWWSKTQQNPAGGQNPNPPVGGPATCQPTDVNSCPAGPPADGIYVVYDYESVVPTAVTGPVGNLPSPTTTQPPSPAPNLSAPQPLGPTAYGAVRYIVPEGAEAELSLTVLSRSSSQPGGTDPTVGKLFACAVSTPGWAAVQNGRYDQGPKFDCTTADEAELLGDTATFRLSSAFVQGTTLDVAIVGAGDRPFQMSLAAPANSSLQILNAPETLVDDAIYDDGVYEDPLTSLDPSVDPLPDSFAPAVAFTSDDASALPRAPVMRPQPRRAVPAGRVVNPFGPDASRGQRLLAVALLAAMALALWWLGGQPVRAPRLLGSLGGSQVRDVPLAVPRGIGRFARPREGRPPRLF